MIVHGDSGITFWKMNLCGSKKIRFLFSCKKLESLFGENFGNIIDTISYVGWNGKWSSLKVGSFHYS